MTKEEKKEYEREYYLEHREKLLEQRREYYIKNRKKLLERMREYGIEHKEEILESHRIWNAANGERKNGYMRKIRAGMPWTTHYVSAKQRCTNPNTKSYYRYGGRGIKFLLTMEEMKTLYLRDNARDMEMASIDRIYNDGNYVFDNCRFIERSENTRRRFEE